MYLPEKNIVDLVKKLKYFKSKIAKKVQKKTLAARKQI
jgi:hypothetical protein